MSARPCKFNRTKESYNCGPYSFNFAITAMSDSHYSPKHFKDTILIARVFGVPHRGFGWRSNSKQELRPSSGEFWDKTVTDHITNF